MIRVAFYKASGNLVDKAIRLGSNSVYSHVEVIGRDGLGWSSSQRDGGVRTKQINFDSESWDVFTVPWVKADFCESRIVPHLGKKYDYAAIVLSHMFAVQRHNSDRWICSELVAHSMGLPAAHTFSPGRLAELICYMGSRMDAQ